LTEKKTKAILLVSFGTTYKETRELTIDSIEENIKNRFSDFEIRRAFTSHMIIKVLRERDGLYIDTPEEALNRLAQEGFSEVIVQSLHIIPGEEYEYVEKVVKSFAYKNVFERIALGRPILHFKGDGEELPDDYSMVVEALKLQLPESGAVVFMGHGSPHPANACYACLQMVMRDHNINNVYIGTVEGYPTLDNVINNLRKDSVEEVTLMPLMIVAGDHCMNDMASDEEDSWKTVLVNEGFKVTLYTHGMGENTLVKEIFAQHVEDVILDRYKNMGKTKKGQK
jgi:sirohydrochlorin cobaltochelatase